MDETALPQPENTGQWEGSREFEAKSEKIKNDIRKFSLVRTVSLAVLVLTLPAAVVLVQSQTQKPRTMAVADKVSGYFVPNWAELPPNKAVRLMLDSGTKKVSHVRLEVRFDSNKINLVSTVVTTPKLKIVREKTEKELANETGKAVVELALAENDTGFAPEGVFEAVSFVFEPVTSQTGMESQIQVDVSKSVIRDLSGAEMEIEAQPARMIINFEEDARPEEETVLGVKTGPVGAEIYVPEGIPTDLDRDGCVGFTDLRTLGVLYGKRVVPGTMGDLNTDGKVNLTDVGIWADHYGYGCR